MSGDSDVSAILLVALAFGGFIFVAGMSSPQSTVNVSAGLSTSIKEINWGNLTCGESKQVFFTLTNVGDVPLQLSFSTSNCEPTSLLEYADFTFNLENTLLQPQQTVDAAITIHIFREASFKFKVDLNIVGIEIKGYGE
jgi:hypothetical protein